MNYLESYYYRKDKIAKILSGNHYDTDRDREMTVSAWANSNLNLEEIKGIIESANIEDELEGNLRPGPGVLTK